MTMRSKLEPLAYGLLAAGWLLLALYLVSRI